MRGIDKESVGKLHGEINNYMNQQYTLYVTAVTLVGAVIAWVSPQPSQFSSNSGGVAYLAFAALSVFLTLIAILEARLTIAAAICASYLRLAYKSDWERDIEHFRSISKNQIGISTREAFYFILGVIVAFWPVVLNLISPSPITLSHFFLTHVFAALAYFFSVFFLIPWGVRMRQLEIENNWAKVIAANQQTPN
jgi:hypothetical protein